jgi:NAD(P)-dependent dehydrogenase (short-subunit alcohol dehydrogenase family)
VATPFPFPKSTEGVFVDTLSAIVTGGSGGIGLAIAHALGDVGYELTIAGRDHTKLEHAIADLAAAGIRATPVETDLTSEDMIHKLIGSHRNRHKQLDVLVNNAGIAGTGGIEDTPTHAIDAILATNLRSVQLVTRECLPLLKCAAAARGTARIVNLSSIVGKTAAGRSASYSAAKAGVLSLTQSMHSEFAPLGIRATALCPSYVNTSMSAPSGLTSDEMIQPSDLAEAVRFLLSTSQSCCIPEITFQLPTDRFSTW